jgi:hypothetical protein
MRINEIIDNSNITELLDPRSQDDVSPVDREAILKMLDRRAKVNNEYERRRLDRGDDSTRGWYDTWGMSPEDITNRREELNVKSRKRDAAISREITDTLKYLDTTLPKALDINRTIITSKDIDNSTNTRPIKKKKGPPIKLPKDKNPKQKQGTPSVEVNVDDLWKSV